MALARDLWNTYHRKLYTKWGYDTFDAYLAAEGGVSKDYARRMRRIFSVMVMKCGIRPAELDIIGRSKAQMLLPVIDKTNARKWVTAAKELPCGELQAKIYEARYGASKTNTITVDDDDETSDDNVITVGERDPNHQPVKLRPKPHSPTRFVKRTFSLPEESDSLLDEALGEAQRITNSASDGFNLTCVAQHFLAHRLTDEGKNDGRLYWFMRQMERIYGVRLLHIKSDKAWNLLRETVEDNQDAFGTTGEFTDDQERNSRAGKGQDGTGSGSESCTGEGDQDNQEGSQVAEL